MAFELPLHFAENMNSLGMLISLCDHVPNENDRRNYLLTGMGEACSLLNDLYALRYELSIGVEEIGAPNQAAARFVRDHLKLFLSIEDLILRDAGIDEITRKIMLNNTRQIEGATAEDGREFNGGKVVAVLENLRNEVCERSNDLAKNPAKMRKLLAGVVTFGLPPINIAAGAWYPVFLPMVFKASAYVGTVVSVALIAR